MIADEVLTGFGRTGRMFACEHAGGRARHHLPVEGADRRLPAARRDGRDRGRSTTRSSATIARKTFFHGHSFTANPLACAVALASLDLFARDRRARPRRGDSKRWLRDGPRRRCATLPSSATSGSSAASASSSWSPTRRTKTAGGYLDQHRPAPGGGVPRARPAAAAARQRALLHAALRDHRGRDRWVIEQIAEVVAAAYHQRQR